MIKDSHNNYWQLCDYTGTFITTIVTKTTVTGLSFSSCSRLDHISRCHSL